jgi:hypothetical protein
MTACLEIYTSAQEVNHVFHIYRVSNAKSQENVTKNVNFSHDPSAVAAIHTLFMTTGMVSHSSF